MFKFNTSKANSNDRFVLSKGHAAAALYSVLAEKKIIPKSKLSLYGKNNSNYEEHPNFKIKGIDCSTGSLGHGLSFGIGISISKNLLNKYWNNFYMTCLDRHDPFEKHINDIYNREICISPLKSLSLHLTNVNSSYGLSPFIDYKKIWEENKY